MVSVMSVKLPVTKPVFWFWQFQNRFSV